jgi:hypothetical protein
MKPIKPLPTDPALRAQQNLEGARMQAKLPPTPKLTLRDRLVNFIKRRRDA